MQRRQNNWSWIFLLVAVVAIFLYIKYSQPGAPVPPGNEVDNSYSHLRWGNPSGATADPDNRDNFLMKKPYYALSYNNTKGTPNWVSWRLVKEDVGNASREGLPFLPDEELPGGFKKIVTREYAGTGFDRGHMCPAGDRSSDPEVMKATFVMTNLVPQSPNNNRKGWEQFESYCRSLVKEDEGKELYIVSGPRGEGGTGEKGFRRGLPDDENPRIVVPDHTWKVVMVLNRGAGPGPDTRLIAVDIPNDQTVGEAWAPYRVPVREIEQLTGYTFFDRADPNIIGPLKDQADALRIPAPRPHGR
jgi:endonuclease G, mitochondrial